jgi:hypothetical protein
MSGMMDRRSWRQLNLRWADTWTERKVEGFLDGRLRFQGVVCGIERNGIERGSVYLGRSWRYGIWVSQL